MREQKDSNIGAAICAAYALRNLCEQAGLDAKELLTLVQTETKTPKPYRAGREPQGAGSRSVSGPYPER